MLRHITSLLTALTSLRQRRSIESHFLIAAQSWTFYAIQHLNWRKTMRSSLQAWALFVNHYHLVIGFENTTTPHRDFIQHLHRELAVRLNRFDATPGRRVMYEFWDTRLTFEKSWLARLNYVHQNAVKHGLVLIANEYPWCSASWFEGNARPGFVKSVYSFKTDRIKVPDDF